MAKNGEQFRYKISLYYTTSDNQNVEISSLQLQYLLIDKDFDKINMPVISVFGSIEKNILDDMILNIDYNTITLGIYKYDAANQNDNITEKYFQDTFIYILKDDISKTSKLDNPTGVDSTTGNTQLKEVNIFLIQQDAVNNNRQTINGVYYEATMNTLILQITNYVGKVLLEPIKYDTEFDQVMVPPQDSISNYIKYLNDNIGVFYDTPYRFFMDFDATYIVSSSGNMIEARNQYIYTIVIEIKEIDNTVSEENGMYMDLKSGKCTVVVDASKVSYTKNNVTNKLVNKVTVVNAKGEKREQELTDIKTQNTSTINQIINISNNDDNTFKSISNDIESASITLSLVKNDLDASIFTLNKEYIINDSLHSDYSGKYILTQSKQLFVKQNEYFIMSTVLSFRKVIELDFGDEQTTDESGTTTA